MRSKTLVTSNSNYKMLKKTKYFKEKDFKVILITQPPTKTNYEKHDFIIAIGGGSVIDTAKLMAKDICIVIPTTASGASQTSHAVVWQKNRKIDIETTIPWLCTAYRNLPIKLSKQALEETYWDCFFHIHESENSIKANHSSLLYCKVAKHFLDKFKYTKKIYHLIDAGNWAGKAIEITGTNLYHAISYVLTLKYGLRHGEALKAVFKKDKKYDWDNVLRCAKKYPKFKEFNGYYDEI